MTIRAVAFDIDGTLYSNSRFYLHSAVFGLRNLHLTAQFRKVRRELRRHPSEAPFHERQAALLADRLGVSLGRAKRLIEERFYRGSENMLRRVPLFPGVRSTLRTLRREGFQLAAASDFPVERKLRLLGLDHFWDCAYSTEDTGYLKPHPRAFEPLKECFRLHPSEILYVGNSYEYDILGASAAGFRTAHIARFAPRDSVADLTFVSYRDLLKWILGAAAPQ